MNNKFPRDKEAKILHFSRNLGNGRGTLEKREF